MVSKIISTLVTDAWEDGDDQVRKYITALYAAATVASTFEIQNVSRTTNTLKMRRYCDK